ncbi:MULTISPECIES: helix-turn-helix domain-containing protein [Sphingobium]
MSQKGQRDRVVNHTSGDAGCDTAPANRGRGGWSKVAKAGGVCTASVPIGRLFLAESDFQSAVPACDTPPRRGGIPPHNKTPEKSLLVSDLVRSGKTRPAIARAIGVSQSTLYAIYFSELGVGSVPRGRPRHVPTDATRAQVARMRRAGASKMTIAKALGVSEPTLRRAYADELFSKRKGTESE